MDAFFASVEQRDNPALRGKPIAVGGGGRRGVVAAASYEARVFGVRSAMPGFKAKELCPELIFVKHRFEVYREISQTIRTIFSQHTDLIEPLSLDEAYLDVTENKQNIKSAIKIAMLIRQAIFEQTNLTASAGISFNKFLAKIASDINKPNGLKAILPDEAAAFLEKLPIEKFHGIGKVTAKKMHRLGIYTGGDLKKLSKIEIATQFGKMGMHYYKIVRAEDNRPVNPNRIRKSIGAERTFSENIMTFDSMKEKLIPIVNGVFEYMQEKDNFGRTLTLKIKTSDFKQITRSKSFNGEMRTFQLLIETTLELLENTFEELGPVRLLGIAISNLEKDTPMEGIQLKLKFNNE